jgi:hypothetical protein
MRDSRRPLPEPYRQPDRPISKIWKWNTGMFGNWPRKTLISLVLGMIMVAPAHADSPGSRFKLAPKDIVDTITSPDHLTHVEQYFRDAADDGVIYQFWTFDGDHQHGALLNRGEDVDLAGYPAWFRFSPDSQWLVRMQKTGAGYQTMFLYRRRGFRFSAATPKPLGDLAWDYFFEQPIARQMHRHRKDRDSLDHLQAGLIKGLEENYAWMGQHWPDSRYLVIGLSFDSQGEDKPGPWIEGWHCVYDLKTGTFSIPPDFVENNAKAVKTPGSDK